jgi:hypothetical protein
MLLVDADNDNGEASGSAATTGTTYLLSSSELVVLDVLRVVGRAKVWLASNSPAVERSILNVDHLVGDSTGRLTIGNNQTATIASASLIEQRRTLTYASSSGDAAFRLEVNLHIEPRGFFEIKGYQNVYVTTCVVNVLGSFSGIKNLNLSGDSVMSIDSSTRSFRWELERLELSNHAQLDVAVPRRIELQGINLTIQDHTVARFSSFESEIAFSNHIAFLDSATLRLHGRSTFYAHTVFVDSGSLIDGKGGGL